MIVDPSLAFRIMSNLMNLKKSLGRSLAADPVAFFGFEPQKVHSIYFWKSEQEGTWFRLHDGRIFDENAQPADPEESAYKAPSSPPQMSY